MMNLKEAFRYQNFLTNMIDAAVCRLANDDYLVNTTKTHKFSELGDGREDEEEVIEPAYDVPAETVIEFISRIIREKEYLSKAIAAAKRGATDDIDVLREVNIAIRSACRGLGYAARAKTVAKTVKKKMQEMTYRFDANGVQQPCRYSVDVTKEPAVDVDNVRTELSRLRAEADKNSEAIDLAMVTTKVAYTPIFDVNDSYDNVIADFHKNYTEDAE